MLKVDFEIHIYTSFKQVSKIYEKNLSTEEIKALNALVKNEEIVIQKSDKVNNIVILIRGECISNLLKILEDTSNFREKKL